VSVNRAWTVTCCPDRREPILGAYGRNFPVSHIPDNKQAIHFWCAGRCSLFISTPWLISKKEGAARAPKSDETDYLPFRALRHSVLRT
jgi:hypothetical protein